MYFKYVHVLIVPDCHPQLYFPAFQVYTAQEAAPLVCWTTALYPWAQSSSQVLEEVHLADYSWQGMYICMYAWTIPSSDCLAVYRLVWSQDPQYSALHTGGLAEGLGTRLYIIWQVHSGAFNYMVLHTTN